MPITTRYHHRLALLMSLLITALLVSACGGGAELQGTDLGKEPAPDFTLIDQRGQQVSLSQFRGKAIALTFIYTHCPDICPLTAQHFRQAFEQLPQKIQERVVLMAVTVDPARDTPPVLQDFSDRHGLGDNPNWYALTGDPSILEPLWASYYIDPGAMMTDDHDDHGDGTHSTDGELFAHTDAVFLIDRDGNERVLLRSHTDPKVLAQNLKILAD